MSLLGAACVALVAVTVVAASGPEGVSSEGVPAVAGPAGMPVFDEATAVLVSEDMYTQTFRDGSGMFRDVVSLTPERVFYEGAWVPASSELAVTEAGVVAVLDPLSPVFSPKASDEVAVTLSSGEATLLVGVEGLAGSTPRVGSGEQVETEHGVVYEGALDGADVVFGLDKGTLREAVVLTQQPVEQPVYRWRFEAPGLTPQASGVDTYEFLDSAGEVAFTVNEPVMWDSLGEGMGDSASTFVDFVFSEAGQGVWEMTLTPQWEWLTAPERVYPVMVDPVVSRGPVGILTYKEDNYTKNYGAPARIGNSKQTSTCCAWRTYTRFDLSPYFGYRVMGASLVGTRTGYTTPWYWGGLYWASSLAFNGVTQYVSSFSLGSGSLVENEPGGFYISSNMIHNRDAASHNSLRGDENDAVYTLKQLTIGLVIDYVSMHTITTVTGPANGEKHVVQPVFSATGTVAHSYGQRFRYVFTSDNGGVSHTSAWVGPGNYQIQDGTLTPGKHYTYKVESIDNVASSPVVTKTSPAYHFWMDTAPSDPTGIAVDGVALTGPVAAADARPVVSAVVSDVDGGQVQALFTIRRDGIVVMDSVPGSWVNLDGSGPHISQVQLPYALSAGATYTVSAVAFDGHMASGVTTATGSLSGPPRTVRDLPADDDTEAGAAQ